MATLPLYDPNPAHPDAWHRVTAPGGYEWWYFDAEADDGGAVRLVAIFFEGFVFHPGYLRRYAAYRRRPTRFPPPVPSEYPCAYFAVYEGGRLTWQFMSQYPAHLFAASAENPDVRTGPNSMRLEADGAYCLRLSGVPWRLTARGPRRDEGSSLSAELTFRPAFPHAPHEREFLSRRMTGADHRWVIAAPLCRAEGAVRVTAGAGVAERVIEFRGRGYHDHNYGSGPIGPGLRRWVWGRLLLDDQALTFHMAEPLDGRLRSEAHLVEADAAGTRELPAGRAETRWSRAARLLLHYPAEVRIGDWGRGELKLLQPRVVDLAPFYLRLTYQAHLGARVGRAFCEVAYPHRLRWPVLGRMIEMSIHRADGEAGGAL